MLAAFDSPRIQSKQSWNSICRDRHEEVSANELEAPSERMVCNERKDREVKVPSPPSEGMFTHRCPTPVLGREGNPDGARDVQWFLVEGPSETAEFSNVLYGVENFWDPAVPDGEPTGVGGGDDRKNREKNSRSGREFTVCRLGGS